MEHYAGIGVSLEQSSVCVVDAAGRIVRGQGGERAGGFDCLVRELGLAVARVGLEAGPLSQWLYAAMQQGRLPAELLETRHVHT